MSPGPVAALATLAAVAAFAAGCGGAGDRESAAGADPDEYLGTGWEEADAGLQDEDVEPIATQVFERETPPDAGSGRLTVRFLVPPGAGAAQLRLSLLEVMDEEARRDTTLVAIRSIAYGMVPRGPDEAGLVPLAWGEWVPPGGWEDAGARRGGRHRSYTFIGADPEW